MYRLIVGLYARKPLAAGREDDKMAVRSVLELSLQEYNSKLHLPGRPRTRFAHTDAHWSAEDCDKVPAVQCAVLTSASRYEGKPVFDFDSCDLSTPDAKREIAKYRASLPRPPAKYVHFH